MTTTSPTTFSAPLNYDESRQLAAMLLTELGFVQGTGQDLADWFHPDGRVGRPSFTPDYGSTIDANLRVLPIRQWLTVAISLRFANRTDGQPQLTETTLAELA